MNEAAPRTRRTDGPALSPTVIGSIVLIVAIIGVTLSYNANRGLPFVPTYDITVEVPDAARLVEAGSEVRIGASRVGVVTGVTAVRGNGNRPPFARVRLALDSEQQGLPADTRVTIRPRSLLGAKYVELQPGRSRRELPPDGTLPLSRATPVVELSDTFELFGGRSAKALQDTIVGMGTGLAGRGTAVNVTIEEVRRGLGPLQALLRRLTAQDTDLDGFIDGVAAFSSAVTPRAGQLGSLIEGAATTFEALDAAGRALPDAISELAATERVGIRATAALRPVLADAAAIARDLRPATRVLPRASRRIGAALAATTPGLRRVPDLRAPAERALRSVDRLARDPATGGALRQLTSTVVAVRSVLGVLGPAQEHCNLLGVWTRNTSSIVSQGDANGNWLTFLLLVGQADTVLHAERPAPRLHLNPYPRTDATECEAGNEVFGPGRKLGRPEGVQDGTDETRPPAAARARAARAGLLAGPSGSGR